MMSGGVFAAGCVLLLICVASSLMLALEHLVGISLPGCGEGSGCAEAAASVWGTVPYVNWPVSFLGLSYFLGVLLVWLGSRRGMSAGFRWLLRLGALISIGFTIIMVVEGHVCQYCVALHLCNVIFTILIEFTKPLRIGALKPLAICAGVFVLSSAILGVAESRERADAGVKAEEKLAGSTAEIIAASTRKAETTEVAVELTPETDTESEVEAEGEIEAVTAASLPRPQEAEAVPFTGRYRLGPEEAAIRVVLIGDYQCRECRRIEGDVLRIFHERDDMSVSFKHYPMNSDCNRMAQTKRHPNACWAARAAEAAGALRGNAGFWEMHEWLYSQGGAFTNQTFPAKLRELGYDYSEFVRIMNSDETLDKIKGDVEEAVGYGVWFTPTVYINGVELRGWEAPRAVERAITGLAATNPPRLTAAADHPVQAVEKLIGDWLARPVRTIPEGIAFRSTGPVDAAVRIVLFGDYQQKGAGDLNELIQEILAARDDVRYEYHHFPFSADCNPAIKRETDSDLPCQTAYAAEAVGRLAGADAYWRMHAWLFEHRDDYSPEAFLIAAGEAGLDLDKLRAEMAGDAVKQVIRADCMLGNRLAANSVPSMYINGQRVPRWLREGENILPDIVERAAEGD